jgi:hypothetical protein
MTKQAKIPRITSINHIEGYILTCTFNTGEQRKLDLLTYFLNNHYSDDTFRSALLDENQFNKVSLRNGTLCWPDIVRTTRLSNGMEFQECFDMDPIVLYDVSTPAELTELVGMPS